MLANKESHSFLMASLSTACIEATGFSGRQEAPTEYQAETEDAAWETLQMSRNKRVGTQGGTTGRAGATRPSPTALHGKERVALSTCAHGALEGATPWP